MNPFTGKNPPGVSEPNPIYPQPAQLDGVAIKNALTRYRQRLTIEA